MIVHKLEIAIGSGTLSLETGKLAKQAHGAVVVTFGETMVLATAVEGAEDPRRDFFPLVVDYREKFYSAGVFPGGYIKRENRPSLKETLTARLIDRPIRPLFPANYLREVQIMVSTLTADRQNDPDILGMIGASAALHISHLPFLLPTAAVRIGRVNGQLIPMPTQEQLEQSDLDLVIAGTKAEVTMIEGFAREMPEDQMIQAIVYGQSLITRIVEAIEKFREIAGLPPKQYPAEPPVNPLIQEFKTKYYAEFTTAKVNAIKADRYTAVKALKDKVKAEYLAEGRQPAFTSAQVEGAFAWLEERVVRDQILGGRRIDGRAMDEIRPIHCEAGLLPRVHGSALFQRGETQALVTVTLGTSSDEQSIEGLNGKFSKKFMLDYNFPPFSVGECKPIRAPGRREMGHGALAERSLKPVLPVVEDFPYTIRLVSDILESNGSSSQASVCGGTLALMDAGVPITNPVAGISIGLVMEGDRHILLTDIQGDEDHFCDMDFKVAGTGVGITGIQLDLKINGINEAIIRDTLEQARLGRRHILKQMLAVLRQPREEISQNAPRLLTVQINPEKIGMLIGPGGKNIKGIQESTGAKINIEDDGTVYISHIDAAGAEAARRRVEAITEEIKVGKTYEGKVTSIKEFGAFVEIAPGRDGLCHISELDDRYIERVDEVCKIGDILQVRVIAIDEHDRVKLSRKVILRELAGKPPEPPREERSGGGDRGGDRGGRGGDRGGRGGDRGGRGGDRGGDRGPREPRGEDRGPDRPREERND
ncbi:MAG: polyribonucleotide nucleotidyltransferase [Planctomycetota bacterium]|nr:polyribonucleotide nucleotidyltransferase [Planctomycetota bacterium]